MREISLLEITWARIYEMPRPRTSQSASRLATTASFKHRYQIVPEDTIENPISFRRTCNQECHCNREFREVQWKI